MTRRNRKMIALVAMSLITALSYGALSDSELKYDAFNNPGPGPSAKSAVQAFPAGGASAAADATKPLDSDSKYGNKDEAEKKESAGILEKVKQLGLIRSITETYKKAGDNIVAQRDQAVKDMIRTNKKDSKNSSVGGQDSSAALFGMMGYKPKSKQCEGNTDLSKMMQFLGSFEDNAFNKMQKEIDDGLFATKGALKKIDEARKAERLAQIEKALLGDDRDDTDEKDSAYAEEKSKKSSSDHADKSTKKIKAGLREAYNAALAAKKSVIKNYLALVGSQGEFNDKLAKNDDEFDATRKGIEKEVAGLMGPLALLVPKFSPQNIDDQCKAMRGEIAGQTAGAPAAQQGGIFSRIMSALASIYRKPEQQGVAGQIGVQLQNHAQTLSCGSDASNDSSALSGGVGGGANTSNLMIATFMTSLGNASKEISSSRNYVQLAEGIRGFRNKLSTAKTVFMAAISDSQKKCDEVAENLEKKKQWATQLEGFAQSVNKPAAARATPPQS